MVFVMFDFRLSFSYFYSVVGGNFCGVIGGFLVVFWFLFFVLLLFWVLLVLVFGCFVGVFVRVSWCFYGPFCFVSCFLWL
jgi:hypothetical protein